MYPDISRVLDSLGPVYLYYLWPVFSGSSYQGICVFSYVSTFRDGSLFPGLYIHWVFRGPVFPVPYISCVIEF